MNQNSKKRNRTTLIDHEQQAFKLINEVRNSGGALIIMTGAGMSMQSGVGVFRKPNGEMTDDFLTHLHAYNAAREAAGLSVPGTSPDAWFSFSVPEMFHKPTEKEAWAYWRWRMWRAFKEPAEDYKLLQELCETFGRDRVFVQTTNCDQLHLKAGTPPESIYELHGSLGWLQCSNKCTNSVWPVNKEFVDKLLPDETSLDNDSWTKGFNPGGFLRCPNCRDACLRPNVVIFNESYPPYPCDTLVQKRIKEQLERYDNFKNKFEGNWVVLEIGAGAVVSTLRTYAEFGGMNGRGLIRVNPSVAECACPRYWHPLASYPSQYIPLVSRSSDALEVLLKY